MNVLQKDNYGAENLEQNSKLTQVRFSFLMEL